jgi:phospholipid-transporting ATPase
MFISMVSAAIGSAWAVNSGDSATYLGLKATEGPDEPWNTKFGLLWIKNTGTWILIFCNFVPISLLVTLELVKFWQASFISMDFMLYDEY